MTSSHLFALAGLGVLGIGCQWLAWWTKFPAILYLLLVGILAGPVTGMLDPDRLFGELLFPIVSLSVGVILFEGALTLRLEEIRGHGRVVRNLVTVGALCTWLSTAWATHVFLQFSWSLSFLFGALVVVTGPTVIMPILRTVRPNARIASILRWEGIVIDPLGALLAVLTFDLIIARETGGAGVEIFLAFIEIVLVGLVVGGIAAQIFGLALRRHWIPEYLRNVTALTVVLGVFTLSEYLGHESGLLAVTVMGMYLANMKDTPIADILDFKESLSLLLVSGLFIILASRLQVTQILDLGRGAAGVLLVVLFIARPLAVAISSAGSELTLRERALLCWIAPRGIIAAAVSALFSLRLDAAGVPNATLIVPLAFLVIISTVILQGLTAGRFARWLGVADPEARGLLIVGANPVARAIGKALKDRGFEVILADSSWENISAARMDGLATYFGNAVSEHADRNLDLVGIGRLLAVSAREHVNALACLRFRAEFGAKAVYELLTGSETGAADRHRIAAARRGQPLFRPDVGYASLASLLSRGAEVRATQLSDAFDFDRYLERYKDRAIPLFGIDDKDGLHVFVANGVVKPKAGWTVMSLTLPLPGEDGCGRGESEI